MYLILEDEGALYAGNILVLVRNTGKTSILRSDGAFGTSFYTPAAIDRRSRKFWKTAREAWKEQQK